jgi:hypothetical protein
MQRGAHIVTRVAGVRGGRLRDRFEMQGGAGD